MSHTLSDQVSAPERAGAQHLLLGMLTGHWVTRIISAAAELSVMDHLAAGARTAEDVAAREGSDSAATFRLMRACASLGLLRLVDGGFAVTPMGELLRRDVPLSMRDAALVQGGYSTWQCWGRLTDAVRTGHNQMTEALGMSQFEYFAQHPAEGAAFSAAMAGITALVVEDAIALIDTEDVVHAVDVGGANGTLVQALMLTQPTLRGTVLELPHVVKDALRQAEQAGLSNRFTATEGDFLVGVPQADLYLLKWILHDWDDEDCRTILRNCRAAAQPGGRAVVIEVLLGTNDHSALQDINMLCVTSGRERELAEYDALFAATGWRRTAVHPTRSPFSIIDLEAV
jgi:hypothetical protein